MTNETVNETSTERVTQTQVATATATASKSSNQVQPPLSLFDRSALYHPKETDALRAPVWKNCGKAVQNYARFRPMEFHQICGIARNVLQNAPNMTDADWKATVLETCAKQGWLPPPGDVLSRALSAVEQTHTPRPTPVPRSSHARREDPQPLTRAEAAGWVARLGAQAAIKPVPTVRLRTLREVEILKASKLIAEAIVEQVQRCEAAERGET